MTEKDKERIHPPIVYVWWRDSCVVPQEEITTDEAPVPCYMQTIGFIVKEDSDCICLAREMVGHTPLITWRGVITIPKFAILSQKPVNDPEPGV